MKIGLVSSTALPTPPTGGYGGLEQVVHDLATVLVEKGHEVTVFGLKGSKPPSGASFIQMADRMMTEFQAFTNFYKDLDGFDIIHDHSMMHISTHWFKFKEMGSRFCTSWHTIGNPIVPVSFPCAIAVSKDHALDMYRDKHYPAKVVYNGIDLSRFPSRKDKKDHFVFIGRAAHGKGALDALRMCKKLDVPLYMMCGILDMKPDAYVTQVAREAVLGSKWHYYAMVDHWRRVYWLSTAKALLFPIHWREPFGLVMAEALASGTPVIAYNKGSVREILQDGKTGFIVPHGDEKAFMKAMEEVHSIDPMECRRDAEARWSKEVMATGYESIYKEVLEGAKW